MSIITARCPVSQQAVIRVTDFEGIAINVICDEFDAATRTCRLKRRADEGGPLARLLERVADRTLDRRSARCDLI